MDRSDRDAVAPPTVTNSLDPSVSSPTLFLPKSKPKSRFPHLSNKKRLSQIQKRKNPNAVTSDTDEKEEDEHTPISPPHRAVDEMEDQEKEIRAMAIPSPRTRGFSFFASPALTKSSEDVSLHKSAESSDSTSKDQLLSL